MSMISFYPGDVVTLHGLQSASGKRLNSRMAVVVQAVEDDRFQLRVKNGKGTVAIKPSNMKRKDKLPLPDSHDSQRGIVMGETGALKAQKLAELLVRYEDGYRMSEIMFIGEAANHFMRLGQDNYLSFCSYQMEQLGGMCALKAMAQEGECEEVLFALLQANTMCLDCILIMIYQTHLIAPSEVWDTLPKEVENAFYTTSFDDFTPDQDRDCYIQMMAKGPLGLLEQMAHYKFGMAFFGAIRRTRFPHMLVRRLLRIIARESMKTKDGVKLGKKCRIILTTMCQGDLGEETVASLRKGPVNTTVAEALLEEEKKIVSPAAIKEKLNGFFSSNQ